VLIAAAAAGVALGTGGPEAERASEAPDTILYNGRIATLDDAGSTVQALAIRDGVIVATGGDDAVRELAAEDTREIDVGGRRVVPGMVDAHLPGTSEACFSRSPRFDAIFKRTEALMDVADRAQRTPAGRWLFQLGVAWHVQQLDVPGMLSRQELDSLAPSHPVYLRAAGFEGGQLNSRGLRALGLKVGDPGVVRGPRGAPTGQVTGAADARARAAIAAEAGRLSLDERDACTRHFIRELNRRGLTAWDDPGGGDHAAIARLHRAGELNARIRLNFACADAACVRSVTDRQIGEIGDDVLRVGGVSGEVVRPGPRGVYPPGPYGRILTRLAAGGWAFEHGATRATTQQGMVETWERVNARRPIAGLRWRMLHPGAGPTQPNPDMLTRLQELDAGLVPTDAGVLGGNQHPPYRRILDSGTRACLGSDGPYPPFTSLWYAVSGKTYDEAQGGVAEAERLDRMQALRMATRNCDWFMSLDGRIGSLEVGRLADLVVLSGDYFRVPVDEIRSLTSVLTMVGGRVVYGEGGFADLESTASTIER
jgi:predicted amidohydrolase YtcJ